MRKRTKILLGLVASLLVVGSVVARQWKQLFRAYYGHCVRTATTELPPCSRVEVYYLDGDTGADAATDFPVRPYNSYSHILDRKTLTGTDAEAVSVLWRSQTFGWEFQSMCHSPAYGFRFYRGSSLKFETSVCFHCSNFYVTALGEPGWWGFDTKTTHATNLLARLQQIFPASIPEAKNKMTHNHALPALRSSTVEGGRRTARLSMACLSRLRWRPVVYPQGIQINQPWVARNELPREPRKNSLNSGGVESSTPFADGIPHISSGIRTDPRARLKSPTHDNSWRKTF